MPRKRKTESNKAQVIDLYTKLQGNISAIAGVLKISRRQIYRWLKEDKVFKEEIENINVDDLRLDLAEHQLAQLIKDKDFRAIKFFLENKGKSRGYGDAQTINHTGSIATDSTIRLVTKQELTEEEKDDIGYIDS